MDVSYEEDALELASMLDISENPHIKAAAAMLRKQHAELQRLCSPVATRRVRMGRCMLDLTGRRLFDMDGMEIRATPMEIMTLEVFAKHPNRTLTRDQIMDMTLGNGKDRDPFDRSIDVRISRLRHKIEENPKHPLAIRSVRCLGYMFHSPASAA